MVRISPEVKQLIDPAQFPTAITELDWQDKGACKDADRDLFFHPEGERGLARRRRIEKAKKVCATCVVIDTCRDSALKKEEEFGIWGGLSEEERRKLRKRKL